MSEPRWAHVGWLRIFNTGRHRRPRQIFRRRRRWRHHVVNAAFVIAFMVAGSMLVATVSNLASEAETRSTNTIHPGGHGDGGIEAQTPHDESGP